jgi:hypothetical protein
MSNNMQHRLRKILLLAIGYSTLPFSLLAMLLVVNAVNPMGTMFLHTFTIENRTDDEIFVSPIGAVDSEGTRRTLPFSVFKRFEVFSIKRDDFRIPAGTSMDFTYDWDDIQFSEILIRRRNEPWKNMETGLHPTYMQYRRPGKIVFEVRDVASLPDAPQINLSALPGNPTRILVIYLLSFLGLLSPLLIVLGKRTKT